MSELVVCPACNRHVRAHEAACPFCSRALPRLRPQRIALVGRVSRAAVFSAALVACADKKPAAPPAQGSDDLEKMLDDKPKVEHSDTPAPIDAAVVVEPDASIADAGVDAGVPPDAGVVRKTKKVQTIERVKPPDDRIINAKPYGAPPARRRIV